MKKFYSKILPAFIFCSCFLRAEAQYVTIPDTNFVNWLNANGYASCMSGNMMDTTCGAVVNATKINCSSSNINSLEGIQFFDELDTLLCYSNNLSILSDIPNNLTLLNCGYNNLSSLPVLPSSLKILGCSFNPISIFPSLPNSLTVIDCQYNLLTSLPSLPNSLEYLSCNVNQLTSLPSLPGSLKNLNCPSNQITNLPILPNSLLFMWCGSNPLTTLPTLPASLLNLICDHIPNIIFPTLPSNLLTFDCSFDSLSVLPSLPNSLSELRCYHNQLTSIPFLSSLSRLQCEFNNLSVLPLLPSTLLTLHCNNNSLSSLPSLPNSLGDLKCYDNLLSTLPTLPDSMWRLDVYNNPNLTCLPELKRIINFQFNNTGITCLPNYGNVTSSNPLLSSFPLCDLFNANGCDVYWNISGKVYNDSSSNCLAEPNELQLSNFKLILDSAGALIQQTYTGGEGLYSFDTDTGTYTYTVDTTGLPVLVSCPLSGFQTSVLTALDSMDYGMDFGMQCKPGFDIGVTSVARDSGIFRPANFAKVKINAGDISNMFGLHCAAGTSGAVEIIFSGPVSYVGPAAGSLIPVVSGDTLLYSIADLGTVNFSSDFKIIVQTDTSALAGQQICFSVNVTPVTGDLNAANNSLQHCFTVVNSFDPNNKEVFPDGNIDTSQQWLTYTINFQNTGTAPAQHIYILDTLDGDFDGSTFTLLSYSHNPLTQVVGNVVRFNFPNINLPDSISDEPNSHGYVQYKVKLKNGLPFGTVIQNTANIIFDFNVPVVTNTTVNEIVNLTGITPNPSPKERRVVLFPNPVTKNELTIKFQSSFNTRVTFELYDIAGREVFSQQILSSATQQIIHLPELSNGWYNCVISSGDEKVNKKIVVLKN